jgi:hypothetical protein
MGVLLLKSPFALIGGGRHTGQRKSLVPAHPLLVPEDEGPLPIRVIDVRDEQRAAAIL